MNALYLKLKDHVGHSIECVGYGNGANHDNIAVECVDCNEVLTDANLEDEP